jgi:arabinofuranosyltransferase
VSPAPRTARSDAAWQLALAGLLLGFALILIRSAWLCDDAYITFRSVDHLLSGHGARWNVAERVQAYTHPLWMLLLTLGVGVTGSFDVTPLVLSVLLTLASVLILALRIANGPGAAVVAVTLLGLSRAFIDYSTSGLENPLSHLLLVGFALAFLGAARRDAPFDDARLALCWGIAGVAVLCRMDTALLYAPALLVALRSVGPSRRSLGLALAALAPVLLWEAFSLCYYGFALPNTAPAKLGSGIPTSDLVVQGLLYLKASLATDPITLVAIAAGCALGMAKRDRGAALAIGALLYLVYVVRIGGDFMAGRHLTLPLLTAVVLLARSLPRTPTAAFAALATSLALGGLAPHPTPLGDGWIYRGEPVFERNGIADERSLYAPYTAPWNGYELREHPWAQQGRAASRRGAAVIPRAAIGLFGFHAGPEVHVVDVNALSDPLLARLPARDPGASRIGHHTRDIPDGYLETLRSGENQIADPALAAFYDRLSLLTRGELMTRRRLVQIARFAGGVVYAPSRAAAPEPAYRTRDRKEARDS